MGLFDAIVNRGQRKRAADVYAETLAYLTSDASREEVELAREAAAHRAGEHLTDAARAETDRHLEQRLSIDEASRYGEVVMATPLDAIVHGGWRQLFADAHATHGTWLLDEHRQDQHWQAAEAVMRRALDENRVDDRTVDAIDRFIAEVDPEGANTMSEGWYRRFASARLHAGHLSRPRLRPRLITQADETLAFAEEGTVVEIETFLDGSDRTRERITIVPVQIDASDLRIAVFANQLVFSTEWRTIVGVDTGEDEHGAWVRLDDAELGVSHVVHTPMADLLATVARELVRRTTG